MATCRYPLRFEGASVKKTTKAWHFLRSDRKLRFPHNGKRDVRVRKGLRLVYKEQRTLRLCSRGLHASVNPLHALYYAPGPILCRVEMAGNMIKGGDKLAARERTVLWWVDATDALAEFALWCADRAVHLHLAKALRTTRRTVRLADELREGAPRIVDGLSAMKAESFLKNGPIAVERPMCLEYAETAIRKAISSTTQRNLWGDAWTQSVKEAAMATRNAASAARENVFVSERREAAMSERRAQERKLRAYFSKLEQKAK